LETWKTPAINWLWIARINQPKLVVTISLVRGQLRDLQQTTLPLLVPDHDRTRVGRAGHFRVQRRNLDLREKITRFEPSDPVSQVILFRD
jgi:hypothetical protein